MTQVSRKGFVDKNRQKVVIMPNVPGATSGNLASFDAEGNLRDSGIDAGLVGNAKFLYKLEIQKSGGAYVWGTSTTQTILEEVYNTLANGPSDAIPVRVQLPGFTYAGYADKGQLVGVKELHIFVGTVAFQVYYDTTSNQWNPPIIISGATVLDALKSTEQLSSGNDYRLITSKAVYDALLGKMGALKEIFIDCDESDSADAWEIKPDAAGEAAFRAALIWGDNAPRLVIVNIRKYKGGTTNLKTYRTIGSIHATAVEVNVDAYDLTAEIYVDGHVFTRTGEEFNQEQTWGQGLTLEANDIFTHVSNS